MHYDDPETIQRTLRWIEETELFFLWLERGHSHVVLVGGIIFHMNSRYIVGFPQIGVWLEKHEYYDV